MLGRDLEALINRAREFKKEYGDSFVSVEHLVLGFSQDPRFGKQLFRDFQINEQKLKSAVEAVRGRQSVIDQGDCFPNLCVDLTYSLYVEVVEKVSMFFFVPIFIISSLGAFTFHIFCLVKEFGTAYSILVACVYYLFGTSRECVL